MWTPKEIRKLIALLSGIGLEIAGIILLLNQVQSTGIIDISSSIISGKIQSGSAGLLLCFLGLFVIIFSIIGGKELISHATSETNDSNDNNNNIKLNSSLKRGLIIILSLALLVAVLIFGGEFLRKAGWGMGDFLIVIGVFLSIIEFITIVNFIYLYINERIDNKNEE